ncbi:hypothetical protein WwAna0767 [Wolbachia endosymbiont of Drosophila ananassae]|nr:hypothetical protein WwAna0767 [Wolbachia endosymbiont of Drosophila ananassae]RLT61754.1 hypothetical protein WANA13_1088 [Wolbachia endosymbiont of Drosophila ananassae]
MFNANPILSLFSGGTNPFNIDTFPNGKCHKQSVDADANIINRQK